jgi:cobalt-zinc-cadmium efflux system membrane fusion protein
MKPAAISAALLAALSLAACSRGQAADDAPADSLQSGAAIPPAQRGRIHTQAVAVSTYSPDVRATGTVAFDGDRSTTVLAPISGPVTRIVVQPGAMVSRGQPLAYVSSPDFASAVAAYRKAAAAAANAQHVADLDAQLFRNDAIARRDLEQAQTDAVSARADLDAAAQQLRALGIDPAAAGRGTGPAEGVIRAPLSGTLVERLINPGQLLQAGTTPCFTIADLRQVWVMASVFPADLARVGVGDAALVSGASVPVPAAGKVDYIAALVDPSTKAAAVRVLADNPQGVLRRDMYVDVSIHSRQSVSGIVVPVSAVLRDEDNQPYVFADAGGGRYARRDVTLGGREGDQYLVSSGLKVGDHIVTEGALFVQFAQSQ